MRKAVLVVVGSILAAAAVAAQKSTISEAQAKSAAVERVRRDLAEGRMTGWDWGARPGNLGATRALKKGGKTGDTIYVVLVSAPKAKGHARVIVDATSGNVLSWVGRDFDGAPPDWWAQGLDAPPGKR